METVYKFLQSCETFYLATIDKDQPRVRPLGALCIFENRMYISTNNQKPMFRQMKSNPRVEISATAPDKRWIRLTAEVVYDDSQDARHAMLDNIPSLKNMYKADDGLYEVFYLKNAYAVINSFDGNNESFIF